MRRFFVALIAMLTFATVASANSTNYEILFPEQPAMSVSEDLIEANHWGNGILSAQFPGTMRCSQVCPIMRQSAAGHCSGYGECWCDEGSTTTGYIVCN